MYNPITVKRTTDASGALSRIRLTWHDAHFTKLTPVRAGLLRFLMVAAFFVGLLSALAGLSLAALASFTFVAVAMVTLTIDLNLWWPTHYIHRACTIEADGSMHFHLPLPDGGMPKGWKATDFVSVEYGPTDQWRAKDERTYGRRMDVYGLVEDGRRFVLARHAWEGEVSHEMALTFWRAIREIQEGLRTSTKRSRQATELVID